MAKNNLNDMIVSGYELRQLRRARHWWWTGWLAAVLALALAVYYGSAAHHLRVAFSHVKELSEVQAGQVMLVERLEAAWKHNIAIANTLKDYNDYVHERQSIVAMNRKLAPVAVSARVK